MHKISPLISQQFSEYNRDKNKAFADFVKVYYEYAELANNFAYVVGNSSKNLDIDTCDLKSLDHFYNTYSKYLPNEIVYDRRNFIKILNQIYSAKGTEKAIDMLFRMVFNKDISVSYPGDRVLKASSGIWVQEFFITLSTISGSMPQEGEYIVLDKNAAAQIKINRVVYLSSTYCRIYFNSAMNYNFQLGDVMFIDRKYVSPGQTKIYRGSVVYSPQSIEIIVPGKYWPEGKIIKIKGSEIDTIVKVTKVSDSGGILAVSIIDYGYVHSQDQLTIASPFNYKPTGSIYELDYVYLEDSGIQWEGDTSILWGSELVQFGEDAVAGAKRYTLKLYDYTDTVSEHIFAYSNRKDTNSYFVQNLNQQNDYNIEQYAGNPVIDVYLGGSSSSSDDGIIDQNVTMEMWLESRATLKYKFGVLGKTYGEWISDAGQISNQYIRLQDNYYYQPYSYVIESDIEPKLYNNLLNIVHPAGTKSFSTVVKTVDIDLAASIEIARSLSQDSLSIIDDVITSDAIDKKFKKLLTTDVVISESLSKKLRLNTFIESLSIDDGDSNVNISSIGSYVNDYVLNYTANMLLIDIGLNTNQ